jgi:hypothetical protein
MENIFSVTRRFVKKAPNVFKKSPKMEPYYNIFLPEEITDQHMEILKTKVSQNLSLFM